MQLEPNDQAELSRLMALTDSTPFSRRDWALLCLRLREKYPQSPEVQQLPSWDDWERMEHPLSFARLPGGWLWQTAPAERRERPYPHHSTPTPAPLPPSTNG
jgi:hypothetical protein